MGAVPRVRRVSSNTNPIESVRDPSFGSPDGGADGGTNGGAPPGTVASSATWVDRSAPRYPLLPKSLPKKVGCAIASCTTCRRRHPERGTANGRQAEVDAGLEALLIHTFPLCIV